MSDGSRDFFHTGLDVSRSQLAALQNGWNGALGFAGNSVVALNGNTYYVDASRPDDVSDGKSWDRAFKTITKALTVAIMRNDVIIVAPGDYDEGATLNITTQGLTIKGSDPSGGWHNRAMIMDLAGAGYHLMTINAHEVTIQGIGFSAVADNYDAIRVATTASSYKVAIKNCRFDGWSGEYGVYADGTYDAPDLAILNNHFRSWNTASIRVNTTRALVAGNIIYVLAATSGIQHVPTGGNRPDTAILDNSIYGANSTDIGIEIVGTPTEALFHLSGNRVENCATPVTLAKYTNWYLDNFWGREDWRYQRETCRGIANENKADGNLFYVDLNVATTGLDGKCWASAYQTLAEAIAVCATDIAANRNWARRNTIFVIGDELHEDITVLSEKTDIVGMGTDLSSYPRFMHSWAIAAGVKGARFFNLGFMNDAADAAVALPAGSHGNEFHNCHFKREAGGTHGLTIVTSANIKIIDCEFLPDGAAGLYTSAISLLTGAFDSAEIRGNYIEGAIGVTIAVAGFGSKLANNQIRASGRVVVDTGLTTYLFDNDMISAAVCTDANWSGAITANPLLSAGNWLSCANANGPYPNLTVAA